MDSDPQFLLLLSDLFQETLQEHLGTVYGLWPDGTIACVNDVYWRFARDNDAPQSFFSRWTLGANVLDTMDEPMRDFYRRGYQRCLSERRAWEHTYECSTPLRYRKYHKLTYPIAERRGLFVVHSLLAESAHRRTEMPPDDSLYFDEHGLLHMCSQCRRVRRVAQPKTWDWVPQYVRHPVGCTSHGLCETCAGFYYLDDPGNLDDPEPPISTIGQ